ncbi:hypothetical protein HTIA_0343 [Halorhabdus tiamatea SARL4B]|uniref:Uncharacterized protein n=1 Tax=Halorhabdus tiamatea SARL4B TaxID=1033806 RepID=S6D7B5_9EURY|nr:hypothetical protein HTIA_0343 [Halorhabdus tiamatea SARL4B]
MRQLSKSRGMERNTLGIGSSSGRDSASIGQVITVSDTAMIRVAGH